MIWLTSTSTNINHENHPPNQSTISPQTSTNQPFLAPSNQPSYPIQVIQVAVHLEAQTFFSARCQSPASKALASAPSAASRAPRRELGTAWRLAMAKMWSKCFKKPYGDFGSLEIWELVERFFHESDWRFCMNLERVLGLFAFTL